MSLTDPPVDAEPEYVPAEDVEVGTVVSVQDTFRGYVHPSTVEPQLCFASMNWAFFTTRPLADQDGPEWDKNVILADDPSRPTRASDHYQGIPSAPLWSIVKMAYDGDFFDPAFGWRQWFDEPDPIPPTAHQINTSLRNKIPWLWTPDKKTTIWAGTMIPDFMQLIEAGGGQCYTYMPYQAVRAARGWD